MPELHRSLKVGDFVYYPTSDIYGTVTYINQGYRVGSWGFVEIETLSNLNYSVNNSSFLTRVSAEEFLAAEVLHA